MKPTAQPLTAQRLSTLSLDLTTQNTRVVEAVGWYSEISVAGAGFTLLVSDAS